LGDPSIFLSSTPEGALPKEALLIKRYTAKMPVKIIKNNMGILP
jgi:hypothetical protein